MIQIRLGQTDDLPFIVDVYNFAISKGGQTADNEPVSLSGRSRWFELHKPDEYPVWVLEEEGEMAGYAYLSPYRNGRPALRTTAEVSYYLHPAFQGRGLGSQLLAFTMEEAKTLGFHHLIAILLESNQASIGLLEKHGFQKWGHLPDIARVKNRNWGHLYYGRKL